MQIERNISWGNIVSWLLLIVTMAIGYGKLATITNQNTKDVKEARDVAEAVRNSLILSEAARNAQITSISINVAETRKDIFYMAEKVNEVLAETRKKK